MDFATRFITSNDSMLRFNDIFLLQALISIIKDVHFILSILFDRL